MNHDTALAAIMFQQMMKPDLTEARVVRLASERIRSYRAYVDEMVGDEKEFKRRLRAQIGWVFYQAEEKAKSPKPVKKNLFASAARR